MAFPPAGAIPQESDWTAAEWTLVGTTHLARILVGPAGAIQLVAGDYRVFVRISSAPERPVLGSGTLRVY